MTTDTVAKTAVAQRDGWSVGGMAKGAGMLAPALATMLVVVTTDAVVDPADLDGVLRAATADDLRPGRLRRLHVDQRHRRAARLGRLRRRRRRSRPHGRRHARSAPTLARQLVADAEGAHHDIAVEVRSAASVDDALEVARSVARNNLFKCAVFGNDPNWGRVLAAVGTTAAAFDPASLDVSMNGVQVCRAGGVGEDRSLVDLTAREVHVVVDLHAGDATATVWTNDLTHDYVHENSAYST